MPVFICKSLTPQGKIVKTRLEESNRLACIKKLKKNGMTPISVQSTSSLRKSKNQTLHEKTKMKSNINYAQVAQIKRNQENAKKKARANIAELFSADGNIIGGPKISSRDIRIFTQNFYLLKKANFNNIHALSTVIETTENPKLKLILEDILAGVEAGEYMYTTMEYYENVFPYIYVNMIKVGELSGSLENSLAQAIEYLENSDTLIRRIKKILIPNIAMFGGLIILTIVAVLFGVPMLKGIFESIGSEQELPALTMAVYNFTIKLQEVWYIPVGIIAVLVFVFINWLRTPKGKYDFDYFKYTMPIFGKLLYLLDFSRLMQGVLLNLQNGMRIQDSLEVSKNIVKNTVMLSIIETAINNIFIGQSWIDPFEQSGLGDAMCIEMLKIGMQTDLTEMMEKMLVYIETDINNTLEKIVKVLPEIAYLFVGVVLIFFVCAVLVPCITVYMGGWMFSAYDV